LEDDSLCATDLAEYLVERGVPFADAHGIVGKVVAAGERRGARLSELTLSELQQFSPRFDRRALALFDPKRSVERKRSFGSTNPLQVAQALARWRKRLQ
jgi:argininosuccinate lyase